MTSTSAVPSTREAWRDRPRPYVWEEFKAGNVAAVKHGASSPRMFEPRAVELAESLLALAAVPGSPVAYLCDVSYGPSVAAWARVEARLGRLDEWLVGRGLLDEDGTPRPAVTRLLDRFETQAANLRARLGLDPLSRARLGRDVTAAQVDLARLLSTDDDFEGGDDDGA